MPTISQDILAYNSSLKAEEKAICEKLSILITKGLTNAENKIWQGHPVWFLDGNPIVGYNKQRTGIRLMCRSGADFDEPLLNVLGQKFKDASIFYNSSSEINKTDHLTWLEKSKSIQRDYKNL